MAAPTLTQDYLKSQLHYDPESGVFTRRVARHGCRAGDVVGGLNTAGYVVIQIDRKIYQASRLAFLYMTGAFPPYHADHIDGNPRNNGWANLRAVTAAENSRNQKTPRHNTSGHVGVGWDSKKGRWLAQIMVDHKTKKLGRFKNIEDAIAARKAAEAKYNFHPNHGRGSCPH